MAATVDVIGENRWAGERLAGLDPDARDLYASILRSFADGRPPRAPERSSAVARLVEWDLVQLDEAGGVALAYPFSARPTRHRVRSDDGRSYWAMCAIDALGIPYLVRRPAQVVSREPGSERPIAVTIDPSAGAISWTPPEATAVAARSGAGCSAACACPHVNLFGSGAAAERYLRSPDLVGSTLSVPDATAAGRRLFGDLLEALSSS